MLSSNGSIGPLTRDQLCEEIKMSQRNFKKKRDDPNKDDFTNHTCIKNKLV